MRADQDVDLRVPAPVLVRLQDVLDLRLRSEPADGLDRERELGHPRGKAPVVLLGQDRGRGQEGHLLAGVDRLERRPDRDLGLAVADASPRRSGGPASAGGGAPMSCLTASIAREAGRASPDTGTPGLRIRPSSGYPRPGRRSPAGLARADLDVDQLARQSRPPPRRPASCGLLHEDEPIFESGEAPLCRRRRTSGRGPADLGRSGRTACAPRRIRGAAVASSSWSSPRLTSWSPR